LVEGKDETATYYVPFISKWRIQGKTLFDELTLDDQVRYSLEIDAKKSPKQLVATRPLVDGPQVWVYEYEVSSQKLTIIEVPKPYVPTRGKSVTVFMREK
jgi:hypothetical protein